MHFKKRFRKRFRNLSVLSVLLLSLGLVIGCQSKSAQTQSAQTQSAQTVSNSELPQSLPQSEGTTKSAALVSTSAETASAEAFYQELLRKHGRDCQDCLKPLNLQVNDEPPEGTTTPDDRQLNVLIILDSSGSMAEPVTGGSKMDVAKAAISRFVEQLPDTAQIGLMVYGHTGSNQAADKAKSCAGIEVVYPVAALNRDRFDRAVRSFQPTGYTPIAGALQSAQSVFANDAATNHRNVIYVVSDGIETCDGEPVAAARQLQASQAEVVVNVIGFDVDNEAQRQLQAISTAGGGEYLAASNANELNQLFDRTRNQFELTRYQTNNRFNQNRVQTNAQFHLNQFNTCVTFNLNSEQTKIQFDLNMLSATQDPRAKYRDYVVQRLEQRHAAIRTWQQQVNQDIEQKRDVTLDRLQQNLENVLQQNPSAQ